MRVFKKHELNNFETIVKMSQPVLLAYLHGELKKYYDEKNIVMNKDYILAEGTIPIALVAHMDTVFKKQPVDVFYDTTKNVLWSPEGLGADDRAGVFAILQILQAGYRPCIIFTTDEEKGCLGASQIVEDNPICPFENLKYIVQLDRRGTVDCVFYDCDNKEFVKYVEGFGFIETFGSFTDISNLCPAWKVAGVNLSVGYRDEHSTSEVLFASPLFATIEKVKKMLDVPVEDIPFFKYIPSAWYGYPYAYGHNKSAYGRYDYPGWDDDYDDGFGYLDKWSEYYGKKQAANYKCVCSFCGKEFKEDEVFPVILADGRDGWCCTDCCDSHINWCEYCQTGYEVDEENYNQTLCPDCLRDIEEGKFHGTY